MTVVIDGTADAGELVADQRNPALSRSIVAAVRLLDAC
jgi:hypothetical protein